MVLFCSCVLVKGEPGFNPTPKVASRRPTKIFGTYFLCNLLPYIVTVELAVHSCTHKQIFYCLHNIAKDMFVQPRVAQFTDQQHHIMGQKWPDVDIGAGVMTNFGLIM
jgi:hypothetical protein